MAQQQPQCGGGFIAPQQQFASFAPQQQYAPQYAPQFSSNAFPSAC